MKLAMSSARYDSAGLRGMLKPRGLPDRAGFPIEVPKRNMGGGVTSAQATEVAVSSIGPDSTAVALAAHTPSGGHGRPGGLKHPRSGCLVWAGTAAYSRPVFDGPNDRLSHTII